MNIIDWDQLSDDDGGRPGGGAGRRRGGGGGWGGSVQYADSEEDDPGTQYASDEASQSSTSSNERGLSSRFALKSLGGGVRRRAGGMDGQREAGGYLGLGRQQTADGRKALRGQRRRRESPSRDNGGGDDDDNDDDDDDDDDDVIVVAQQAARKRLRRTVVESQESEEHTSPTSPPPRARAQSSTSPVVRRGSGEASRAGVMDTSGGTSSSYQHNRQAPPTHATAPAAAPNPPRTDASVGPAAAMTTHSGPATVSPPVVGVPRGGGKIADELRLGKFAVEVETVRLGLDKDCFLVGMRSICCRVMRRDLTSEVGKLAARVDSWADAGYLAVYIIVEEGGFAAGGLFGGLGARQIDAVIRLSGMLNPKSTGKMRPRVLFSMRPSQTAKMIMTLTSLAANEGGRLPPSVVTLANTNTADLLASIPGLHWGGVFSLITKFGCFRDVITSDIQSLVDAGLSSKQAALVYRFFNAKSVAPHVASKTTAPARKSY